MDIIRGSEFEMKVSRGTERAAGLEGNPNGPSSNPAVSDPKKCKVCGEPVPHKNFNCCSDQCYREAYL